MKKYNHFFFVIGLLFLGCTKEKNDFSDKSITDTLAIYLDKANKESYSYEDRLNYNKKAFAILINQKNDSLNRANLFKVANRYFNINNYSEYQKTAQIVLDKARSANDTVNIAKAYSYLGDYYTNTTRKDSAYSYYSKAEKIYLRLEDKENLFITYLNISTIQSYENDFSGSEVSAIKALNALVNNQNVEKRHRVYSQLGYISTELKDYDKSLEYYNKALQLTLNSSQNLQVQKLNSLNNIGNVYKFQNKDKLAIEKFQQAIDEIHLIEDNSFLYAILLDNIGYSKFKVKDYSNLPDLYFQSLKIRQNLNERVGTIYVKIHLSEFYLATKDTLNAKRYANEALTLSRQVKNYRAVLAALKQTGVVDPEKSSVYSEEYIKINDSLQSAERKIKDKFARIEYETDEIIQQKDKLAEQNRNMIFFFGLVIMIGILLFVIRNQRARTRELLLKQAQQQANEDIYNLMLYQQNKIEEGRVNEKIRIAQELHDGILGRLFGARLNLDSLNKRQDDAAIDSRNLYLVELKNIEQDIREISHDLNREKSVVNNNFVGIVNNLIEQQENLSDAKVSFLIDMQIEWEKIDNTLKINLYRILQESLQNINKYAQAKNIKIEIKKTEKYLKMVVADDGIGFSIKKKSKGIGLQNMLSRAEMNKGILDIKSKPGKGTTITTNVPIETNTKTE